MENIITKVCFDKKILTAWAKQASVIGVELMMRNMDAFNISYEKIKEAVTALTQDTSAYALADGSLQLCIAPQGVRPAVITAAPGEWTFKND